jgi:hypothetical protein
VAGAADEAAGAAAALPFGFFFWASAACGNSINAAASRSHLRACFIATPSASFEGVGEPLERPVLGTGAAALESRQVVRKVPKLLGNQAYSKSGRDYITHNFS